MLISVIIQLSDPKFTGRFVHSTPREPSDSNPEQGLLVFKVDQKEVQALLQQLSESGVCGFKVLYPCKHMSANTFEYIVEIKQRSQTTFFRMDYGIAEPDPFKATRFGSYREALQQIAEVLKSDATTLNEPVEIRIMPSPKIEPWTIDEILEREG